MSQTQEGRLGALLAEVFADGIVELAERSALADFIAAAGLEPARVREVFRRFIDARWGEAMADGVLTAPERVVLHRIIDELSLSPEELPEQLRMALARD